MIYAQSNLSLNYFFLRVSELPIPVHQANAVHNF